MAFARDSSVIGRRSAGVSGSDVSATPSRPSASATTTRIGEPTPALVTRTVTGSRRGKKPPPPGFEPRASDSLGTIFRRRDSRSASLVRQTRSPGAGSRAPPVSNPDLDPGRFAGFRDRRPDDPGPFPDPGAPPTRSRRRSGT